MFDFNIEDEKYHRIHFIGIGGISMSGIAELLNFYGKKITGSDREESKTTKRLRNLGIDIVIGQKKENIKNPDLIIYTDAISEDNEELVRARELEKEGLPVISRGVFLGALMRNYKYAISVSGSHGKTTVTSILADILMGAGMDPTILLGGELDTIGGNVHPGNSPYFLTEACEYRGNILYYYPQMAIILNISEDHLDYFRDLDHIVDTFKTFMGHIPKTGKVLLNLDDENCRKLIPHIQGELITFGIENEEADYNITQVETENNGHISFVLKGEDIDEVPVKMHVLGDYNVYNGSAAFIAALKSGIPVPEIQQFLEEYRNLHRRMEKLGEYHGADILTDYGHHPKEIRYTLKALNAQKKGRFITVFQPHTYSRTKKLLDDFAESFYETDEIIVTEIYAAREKLDPTIHSKDLVEKLCAKGLDAKYIQTFEEARDYITKTVEKDDLVLTTGCGNPNLLAEMIVEKALEEQEEDAS